MRQQLIICQGLPGSGKSTWARKEAEDNPGTVIRVNRDDIRYMFGTYWVPRREKLITNVENSCIRLGLMAGYDVIVDATNLGGIQRFETLKNELSVIQNLKTGNNYGDFDIVVQDFTNISIDICIERDRNRSNKVGEEVIRGMYDKYLRKE